MAGARALAQTQREIIGTGRLGVPALVHEECLTGVATWKAPIFPSPLCWGATFSPELVERVGAHIGQLMSRLGVHQGLAPVLDVVRDLRWGRTEETIGEDPYLVGTIGSAYVRGLQSAGVVATLKHFVGHSASRAARNLAPVSIGHRELADVLLPPFEMALRSGARSVMNSYTDLDGVPVAADEALLTGRLRGAYGFSGTVVSDYNAVTYLKDLHGVAGSQSEAAVLALSAGIDVELPMVACYGEPLLEAIGSGRVEDAFVDRALERVLKQKCELGLLDADWSPEPPLLGEQEAAIDDEPSRVLAREVAQRSVVLLCNDGTLPLPPAIRLALVGARADVAGAMLGDYSFPMHVGRRFPELPAGVEVPTLREVLEGDPAAYKVSYALGCPVAGGEDEAISEAVRVTEAADVCLAVLGDEAGMFGTGTSGEGCDAVDLRLPGRQEELLETLIATGTPVVLVLLAGRPYDISRQSGRLAGAVCGFFPGEEGAGAISDVLSGRVNPSGRLPISFPSPGGSQPGTYLGAPLAQSSRVSSVDPTPLFAFGHGLSYAAATWLVVGDHSDGRWPTEATCKVVVAFGTSTNCQQPKLCRCTCTTRWRRCSPADPATYRRRPGRIRARCDQDGRFYVPCRPDLLPGKGGHRQVDPGEVHLLVGRSSTDIRATLRFDLVGPRRRLVLTACYTRPSRCSSSSRRRGPMCSRGHDLDDELGEPDQPDVTALGGISRGWAG